MFNLILTRWKAWESGHKKFIFHESPNSKINNLLLTRSERVQTSLGILLIATLKKITNIGLCDLINLMGK